MHGSFIALIIENGPGHNWCGRARMPKGGALLAHGQTNPRGSSDVREAVHPVDGVRKFLGTHVDDQDDLGSIETKPEVPAIVFPGLFNIRQRDGCLYCCLNADEQSHSLLCQLENVGGVLGKVLAVAAHFPHLSDCSDSGF